MPEQNGQPGTADNGGSPPSAVPPGNEDSARGLEGAGLRFSSNAPVPEYVRGKTGLEAVQMYEQALQTALAQIQVQNTTYSPPNTTYSPPNTNATAALQPPDPMLWTTDVVEAQRQLVAYQNASLQQQLAQVAAPVMSQTAELARYASMTDTNVGDVWRKYGPEVEALIAGVPAGARSKSIYDQAAEMVRGRHWREIAQEEAEKIAARARQAPESERSGGQTVTSPSGGDVLDQFFDSGHAHLERLTKSGMGKREVRDYLTRANIPAETWVEQVKKSNIVNDGDNRTRSYVMG